MTKDTIKIKLREAIDEMVVTEKTAKYPEERNPQKGNGREDSGKKDYSDVLRQFEKLGGPSMVDVMKITGIPDDDKGVNRSLFRKKVKQIKNPDTGSIYQFDNKELNSVRAALDIKK